MAQNEASIVDGPKQNNNNVNVPLAAIFPQSASSTSFP